MARLDDCLFCNLPSHAIGLRHRAKEVLHLLEWGNPCMYRTAIIGIWGAGGIDFSESEFDDEINDEETLERRKSVLVYKRALVVLDDVNQVNQIIEFCDRGLFDEGSLIFITTRDRDIVDGFVDLSYEMKKLDNHQSLELFSRHAFKKSNPPQDFKHLSWKIIYFCEGIPLALEVIGTLLHNRTMSEWKNVLNKLKGIPDGSRFPVELVMRVIMERSLVKVINGNLHVRDLLQMIAREISPNKAKLKYIYDVFLSFRGEDTRRSFTTHLYTALRQAGIEVYMDEERIERGENISSSLLQAIECSRISIIIFSKNYAASSWCLQELEKIMECYKTTYQEVLPSEVRKQQNAFGKGWERLISRPSSTKGKKLTLKKALTEVANLSGWDMKNFRSLRWEMNAFVADLTSLPITFYISSIDLN
ncbi:hypothetical protein K1719_022937 [Acacia pycnantha]|nr:hypothetical protein K1719_022937 [Acacia pycnantha]